MIGHGLLGHIYLKEGAGRDGPGSTFELVESVDEFSRSSKASWNISVEISPNPPFVSRKVFFMQCRGWVSRI